MKKNESSFLSFFFLFKIFKKKRCRNIKQKEEKKSYIERKHSVKKTIVVFKKKNNCVNILGNPKDVHSFCSLENY